MKLFFRSLLITLFLSFLSFWVIYFLLWYGYEDITEFCVVKNFEGIACDEYEFGDTVLLEKHLDSKSAEIYLTMALVTIPATFFACLLLGFWNNSKPIKKD